MNRDDIIRMAREAGLVRTGDKWVEPARWGVAEIERFAALVAAAERSACAKVCDAEADEMTEGEWTSCAVYLANNIRARGEK